LRVGFFVWEYPPKLVGGLGTYAEYMTMSSLLFSVLLEVGFECSCKNGLMFLRKRG